MYEITIRQTYFTGEGMAGKNITLKSIADSAGVTVSTVSAALNNTGRISDALRTRIEKVAVKMGYQPNLAARLLRSKRLSDIGMIASGPTGTISKSGFSQPLITEFIEICHKEGLRNQIEFWDSIANPGQLPWLLSSGFVGGIIHVGFIESPLNAWLQGNPDFPFVEIGEGYRYSVRSRIVDGIYHAVRHLMALGHRRIALAHGPTRFEIHKDVLAGFKKAVSDFGVTVKSENWIKETKMLTNRSTMIEGLEWTLSILKEKERPTAIIGADMRLSKAIIHGAMLKGLKVPDDISVVGAGASYEAEQCFPAVSTIEHDFQRLVSESFILLRRQMNHQKIHEPGIWCDVKFVERESIARCIR